MTNWPAYGAASLRQCGSLTVSFSDEAVAAWTAELHTTRGGQSWCWPLAILAALTLRAMIDLARLQAEGLIGSIVHLLGLGLRVPGYTTLSRRAATLDVPRRACFASAASRAATTRSGWTRLCGPVTAKLCVLAI